jgi:hypothetical protein
MAKQLAAARTIVGIAVLGSLGAVIATLSHVQAANAEASPLTPGASLSDGGLSDAAAEDAGPPTSSVGLKETIAIEKGNITAALEVAADLKRRTQETLNEANRRLRTSDDADAARKAMDAAVSVDGEASNAQDLAKSASAHVEQAQLRADDAPNKAQEELTIAQSLREKLRTLEDTIRAEWNAADAAVMKLNPITGSRLIDQLLDARCYTAICFDNADSHHWLGIEPLMELPVGKSFSLGSGALSDYVNNHDIKVDLAAGLRVWVLRDLVSFSVYLSKTLSDAPVRLTGSSFVHPASALRRPYPGLSLGVFYDSLWLGLDKDELHNGDVADSSTRDPSYPANAVIASSWTFTLAIQPFTAFRTAIGLAAKRSER